MTTSRPLPVPDEESAPFWASTADHILALARCSHCAQFSHPPDIGCPNCDEPDTSWEFVPVAGHGVVRSWVVMHQSFVPGFGDEPYTLVDVALDDLDDVRLIGRLLDGSQAPLDVGARVRVAFEDIAPDVAVPTFELETAP